MATAWPVLTRRPSRQTWNLTANTQVHVSPFDGSVQTQGMPGAKWSTTIEYASLGPGDAEKMQAFLVGLSGRAGRVAVPNFAQPRPRGTAAGSPLVNGAVAANAAAISIDGLTPGATLLAGDFIGIGGRIYANVTDVTANGSGQATLTVAPTTRAAILDNAAVTLVSPTTEMMLIDDVQGWSYGVGTSRGFVLDLVEAL